ncbi:MAG: DUF2029 domain-containing protein [Clostridiales bacterium]|nr:DUF2029 domain-containing protein [Clostridiales bacterium]
MLERLVCKINKNSNEEFIAKLFKGVIALSLLAFIVSIIFYLCELDWLDFYFAGFFSRKYDPFGDYFNVLNFIQDRDPYLFTLNNGMTANYPPLAYLLLYPFALITRLGGTEMSLSNPMGAVAFGLYLLIAFIPVIWIVFKSLPFTRKNSIIAIISLVISYVAFFEIQRLNINVIALDFVLLFYITYKSEKSWCRNLSPLFIAISGAIKLFPFLLVLVYLKEKRIKDFILSGVYLLVLIFLPFLFFKGGFKNIGYMIKSLQLFVSSESSVGMFNLNDMALGKTLRAIAGMLFIDPYGQVLGIVIKVINLSFFAASILALLFIKNDFKFLLLTTLAYLNFTESNYTYALIFLLMPLLAFFNDKQIFGGLENKKLVDGESCFYILCLTLMLSFCYDLVVAIPLGCIFIMILNVKNGFHKTLSKFFMVVVALILVLIAVYCIITLSLQLSTESLSYALQPSRAIIALILQTFLIVEGISFIKIKSNKEV